MDKKKVDGTRIKRIEEYGKKKQQPRITTNISKADRKRRNKRWLAHGGLKTTDRFAALTKANNRPSAKNTESSPSRPRMDSVGAEAPRKRRLSSSSCGQSRSTWWTESTAPHLGQTGLSAPQSKNPWVPCVWPVRNLQRETSSLLHLRRAECQVDSLGFK